MERQLATLRIINNIIPIEGADAIECAKVGGWSVVVKKGEFIAGNTAVYFEIDSWIPHTLAPFLSKGREPREYNGVKGELLRTVKLRGQLSQGLLLPASVLPERITLNADCTDLLGIQKYEPPIPACLAGQMRGGFPAFIRQTDQERVQNLSVELSRWEADKLIWEVTEKLDGSSMTVYVFDEDEGVCSRNINLVKAEGNTFWQVAIDQYLINKIRTTGRNLALQGELIGEGIQGNKYKIKGHRFCLFDIFDVDQGQYLKPHERQDLAQRLGIDQVPFLGWCSESYSVDQYIDMAEGVSVLNNAVEREGLVYKSEAGRPSFKTISNRFLLKEK